MDKVLSGFARMAGPVKCPECGKKAGRVREAGYLECGECGHRNLVTGWVSRVQEEAGEVEADPDQPPAGTKIVRRELGGGSIAWEVPPSGKSGGLMFFAILWNGFMAVFTSLAGASILGEKGTSEGPGWVLFLFLGLFWAIGIGLFYTALRIRNSRHLLVVDAREVVLVRSLFGRTKRKTLSRGGMRKVEKREFYQQNYNPVYGIELRGAEGKLRFGTTLGEEEKNWLVADIRRVVWPPVAREKAGDEEAAGGAGKVRLSMSVGRSFTIDLPPSKGSGQWPGMLIGFVIVGAFLAIGIFALKDAGFFRYLWLGFNGLFAMGMVAGLVAMLRSRGVTIRVTGDRGEVRVQRMKGRRMVDEKRLPREGLKVQASSSGSSGNTKMMRVALVGTEQVVPIVRWRAEDEVEGMVRELKAALGG